MDKFLFSAVIFTIISLGASSLVFRAGDPNVNFGGVVSNIQQLNMDENNEPPTVIVVVSGAISDPILRFDDGERNLFNPSVVKNGEDYNIVANSLIDFEQMAGDRFLVEVVADSSEASGEIIRFNLIINNLDDERPTITASPCIMRENTTIDISNTNCSYEVQDPDGFLNSIEFTISNSVGKTESSIFQFIYRTEPANNVKTATVYMILQDGVVLDFEETTLWIFQLTAVDGGGNPSIPPNVQIVVQVEDIPDMPPVFTNAFALTTLDEKTIRSFTVTARDGDYGINNPINYRIKDDTGYTTINGSTGELVINCVDRDAGHDSVEVIVTAFEVPDPESTAEQVITFLINDIDDQIPEIAIDGQTEKEVNVEINEGSNDPINAIIMVNDRDLGSNAMYWAVLEDDPGHMFTTAFQVIPNRGYSQTNLSIAITNSSLLDYETPEWQVIKFTLVTTGEVTPTNTDRLPVTITLIDINDEYPEFDPEGYTVSVREDVPKDHTFVTVRATDKDAGDVVTHSLLGTMANNILLIDALSGNISTKIEDSFDYEKQSEVLIQIRALDLVSHPAVTQLTINVIDVNDENPRITVSSALTVDENRPDGTVIDVRITATDEDTNPDLDFSILWNETYAMKNSRNLLESDFSPYRGCIEVTTEKEQPNSRLAEARLTIKDVVPQNTPDFEIFDSLFLVMLVHDKNTEKGTGVDKATVLINIGNLNDNDPEFTESAKTTNRTVMDGAGPGASVGSVTATDVDNLEKLEYSIRPTDDTTPDWIEIHEETGDLSVKSNAIDCDEPNIYYLNYTITVTDTERQKSLDISIYIIDLNDNQPVMAEVLTPLTELSGNNVIVYTFNATDADRDPPYHTVVYQPPNSGLAPEFSNRFRIDGDDLIVSLQNGAQIEWTRETQSYVFSIDCVDNPMQVSNQPQQRTNVRVSITITDINDKKPTITEADLNLSTREDLQEGGKIKDLVAIDEDSEGPNSEVEFTLLKVQRFEDENYENEVIGSDIDYLDLFHLENDPAHKTKIASLSVTQGLRNLYGYYKLSIETKDFGEPQNNVDNTVNLVVAKYNFEDLSFIFPTGGKIYYLSTEQNANSQLKYYNGAPLENLRATDNQNDKFDLKFRINHVAQEDAIFVTRDADSFGNSQGQLQLSEVDNLLEGRDYNVTLVAYIPSNPNDANERPYSVAQTFTFRFFNLNEDPLFSQDEATVHFTEGPLGPTESQSIPQATYANVIIEHLDVFYLVRSGDGRDTFDVDKSTGTITIKKGLELDYENITKYELIIQSSRRDGTPDPDAKPQTQLKVTINVININDNPPIFESQSYYGQAMYTYPLRTSLLKVTAIDADGDELRYTIDPESMVATGTGLATIADPFELNEQTGEIFLTFTVHTNMNGYFTFSVTVTDPAPESHQDHTQVSIYIMTPDNCVNFKFENKLIDVVSKTETIKEKLDAEFGFRSTMEAPKADQSTDGVTLDNVTIAPVYFIDTTSNKPIEAGVILRRVTDVTVFTRLRQSFYEDLLYLMPFDSEDSDNQNLEEVLRAWLIGVSVVLGALCLILLIAFVLRTRALNQRISNLSNTKFGSQESGLNRIAAPTTNKHALEGSNPVYNNDSDKKEIDRRSIASGDSDLIGVEDNPEFSYENNYHTKNETTE